MNQGKNNANVESESWLYRRGPELIGVVTLASLLGFFLLWPAFQNARDSLSVDRWEKTQATVTKSRLNRNDNGSGRITRSYRFKYQYQIGDRDYTGWRYSLAFPSGSPSAGVKRYQKGQAIAIYYHPTFPARSVVDPKPSAWWNFFVLGMVFFLTATAIVIRYGKRRRS